eukprot:m.149370 g.149370  ORF g.149370 m.149370 type:complete len:587 (+) comp38521_c0_seq2:57-1817(+)
MARARSDRLLPSFLALFVVLLTSTPTGAKSVVLFERNRGGGFDFYPRSATVVNGAYVTLFCNGTATGGVFRSLWLRRPLGRSGPVVNVRNARPVYFVGAQYLRIRSFNSEYAGEYACGRGPSADKGIGDWISLTVANDTGRGRACPYLDPPYDYEKTSSSIFIHVDNACRLTPISLQMRLSGHRRWDPFPEGGQRFRVGNLQPMEIFEFQAVAFTKEGDRIESLISVIETYPRAPSHGPNTLIAVNWQKNSSALAVVNVSWTPAVPGPPSREGDIVAYEVVYKLAGHSRSGNVTIPPANSVLIDFPEKGSHVTFTVYALNWSPYLSPPSPSVAIVSATPPKVPIAFGITYEKCEILVFWSEAEDDGGSQLLYYEIEFSYTDHYQNGAKHVANSSHLITSSLSFSFRLPPTSKGVVSIRAVNLVGKSQPKTKPFHIPLRGCRPKPTRRPIPSPVPTVGDISESEADTWVRIGLGASGGLAFFVVAGTVAFCVRSAFQKKALSSLSGGSSLGLRYNRRSSTTTDLDETTEGVDVVCETKAVPGQVARVVSYNGKLPHDAPPPYATVLAADRTAAIKEAVADDEQMTAV